ncbi:MAG: hypothetical protein AAFO87_14860 [Cyanobacteria bacterium J06607_6]
MGVVAYQVVYIQCGNARLYGELVQHIAERHNCWLRPLSLLSSQPTDGQPEFLDLRDGPDIICSDELIRPVMDLDWLVILEQLTASKTGCDYPQANQYLRQFLAQLTSQRSVSSELSD